MTKFQLNKINLNQEQLDMKNNLKTLLLAIPLAVLSMVSAPFADTNERSAIQGSVEPYPYISPTPGEFPIIG